MAAFWKESLSVSLRRSEDVQRGWPRGGGAHTILSMLLSQLADLLFTEALFRINLKVGQDVLGRSRKGVLHGDEKSGGNVLSWRVVAE